jgi:sortase (surface protein transpeptidase)
LALSPLRSLVGEAVSAQPVPPLADVAPTVITIDAIGANAPVRSVGIAPDGQLEVPDETHVGWYRLGAAPGQPGATVLAAHVSWHDSAGPFLRLGELEPGAFVDLALADGSSRRYQVVTRAQYGKLMLPRKKIWRTTGPEALVLITCGGAFNPDIRRYADNIVVTAVPVGS